MKAQRIFKVLRILLLALGFFLAGENFVNAQSLEYKIKASILEKFTKFTDWPESSGLTQSNSPFVICIVGDNPFGSILDRVYSFKKIKGRSVKIDYIKRGKPLKPCHVMFITEDAEDRFDEAIRFAEKYSILTFSDTPGWEKRGVCVNLFITPKETVHFMINQKSLKRNKIEVNPLLLDYGRGVE